MAKLTDEQIANLDRLERAVTPAPWRYEPASEPNLFPTIEPNVMGLDLSDDASHPALGLLIEARNALPSLLAEVRASRAPSVLGRTRAGTRTGRTSSRSTCRPDR